MRDLCKLKIAYFFAPLRYGERGGESGARPNCLENHQHEGFLLLFRGKKLSFFQDFKTKGGTVRDRVH